MVVPSRIPLLVIPTSVATVGPAEPPQAAKVTRKAAIAAMRDPVFAIELPPVFIKMYLNSLGIGRHMSTLPIGGPQ